MAEFANGYGGYVCPGQGNSYGHGPAADTHMMYGSGYGSGSCESHSNCTGDGWSDVDSSNEQGNSMHFVFSLSELGIPRELQNLFQPIDDKTNFALAIALHSATTTDEYNAIIGIAELARE